MIPEEFLERVKKINEELLDSDFTYEEIKNFWDDCLSEAQNLSNIKAQQIPMYNFSNLKAMLTNMQIGDFLKIKGDRSGNWVFYDENEGYYFIKHNCHKQLVLIKK